MTYKNNLVKQLIVPNDSLFPAMTGTVFHFFQRDRSYGIPSLPKLALDSCSESFFSKEYSQNGNSSFDPSQFGLTVA